uniref:DNA-directed RNA polymerase III subunit RPC8 n=1 Tax=Polytomella parva TaxID=51329 RepID=A0A7S0V8B2_9CHLO|mmetsp:Transcript_32467/g.58966  ORF Transcript_32467/g.58966 Transcript_32467/m.58966 type:complete len:204 (+) Transcript_32467:59-670(+)|eukprot:CAMPEP_0175060770 /NCGR_PEP_ID=MMETSP0052_2-20121109/13215_1 /TAXON_ID=51329 ORGANISM="Polytomella parva, Strain SAG 63-3" /NCGR_SAMPLE_ID=MMETSP0052_2 /ASSEMBLY_ACC=CAM_ASM_000194 /LENGTH=203 /DNA_ID=CAMNT_0016326553 /DNA_START=38 /DNA_END=649 /DNA_ORIENTATION=-
MFFVSVLEDDIRVHPQELSKPPLQAVTEVIEQKFLDKVIDKVGLAVSIHEIVSLEGGFIYPSDGAAYFKVQFKLVIFRPFPGEVIKGKVKSMDKNGIYVSLGFFDDIFIPDYALQEPSFFDDSEKIWIWKFSEEHNLYIDKEEEVVFTVQNIKFSSIPTPQQLATAVGEDKLLGTVMRPFRPMEVFGNINGDGLGMTAWWSGQ